VCTLHGLCEQYTQVLSVSQIKQLDFVKWFFTEKLTVGVTSSCFKHLNMVVLSVLHTDLSNKLNYCRLVPEMTIQWKNCQ
jgi:hypothetical protein